jgi:hypothetical protein
LILRIRHAIHTKRLRPAGVAGAGIVSIVAPSKAAVGVLVETDAEPVGVELELEPSSVGISKYTHRRPRSRHPSHLEQVIEWRITGTSNGGVEACESGRCTLYGWRGEWSYEVSWEIAL